MRPGTRGTDFNLSGFSEVNQTEKQVAPNYKSQEKPGVNLK